MSTLRTFNLQHPESSNNNIQLAEGGGVSVTAGILTATNVSSTNVTTTEVTATNGTFSGNVSVGGVLSYEDVTNVDSIGIGTFRDGIHVTGGSIGIGTISPSGPIHAHTASGTQRSYLEASAAHSFLRLKSGSTSYNSGVEFFSGASNIANINGLGAGGLQFEVNGSERLRITSDGFIGINNTSPELQSSAARNLVIGTPGSGGQNGLTICSNTSGTNNIYFGDASSGQGESIGRIVYSHADDSLRLHTAIEERLRITSDGKMGVGTQSPDVLLHLSETNADPYNTVITHLKLNNSGGNGGSGSRIELKTGAARCWIQSFIDGANSNSGGALVFGTPSSAALGVERLRITSAGKLTVTPADTTSSYTTTDGGIDIAQTISSTGTSASQSIGIQFSLTKSGETGAIAEIGAIRQGSGLSALVFRTRDNSTGRNERLRIHSHGQLELKVPDANPALKITPGGTNAPAAIDFNTPGTGVAKLLVQGTERLRIKHNGTVHIGDAFEGGGYLNVYATNVENGIDLIGNVSSSSQNSNSAKLRFQGYAQSNGPWIQGINVDGYGYKDLVFGVNRTATDYTTLPTETARFTQDGRFMVNTISSRIVEDWAGNGPQGRIQIEQTNSNALMSIISAGTADANRAGTLVLGRHRNSTVGATPTIVQSGDTTGAIVFAGGDGSDMRSKSAIIRSRVGATPGSSRIPGDLIFATTNTDDGDQPEERLAIDHRATFIRRYPRLTTSGTYDTGGTRGYNSSATGTVRIPGSAGDTFYFSVTMPSYYASGSLPGTVKASIQYATYHASGFGAGEYLIHQRHGANGGRRIDVTHFRKLSEVYSGGWYYGMNTNFTTRLYETTNDEANASIVFRVQVRTGNGSTYDGDARLHIKIETLGGFANHPEPRITWHGTSSPSGLGGEVTSVTNSWP